MCYDHLSVGTISYNNNQEISALTIINEDTRKTVFSWSAYKTVPKPSEEAQTGSDFVPICKDCGKPITSHQKYVAEQIVKSTTKTYGRPLCWDCAVKAKQE